MNGVRSVGVVSDAQLCSVSLVQRWQAGCCRHLLWQAGITFSVSAYGVCFHEKIINVDSIHVLGCVTGGWTCRSRDWGHWVLLLVKGLLSCD